MMNLTRKTSAPTVGGRWSILLILHSTSSQLNKTDRQLWWPIHHFTSEILWPLLFSHSKYLVLCGFTQGTTFICSSVMVVPGIMVSIFRSLFMSAECTMNPFTCLWNTPIKLYYWNQDQSDILGLIKSQDLLDQTLYQLAHLARMQHILCLSTQLTPQVTFATVWLTQYLFILYSKCHCQCFNEEVLHSGLVIVHLFGCHSKMVQLLKILIVLKPNTPILSYDSHRKHICNNMHGERERCVVVTCRGKVTIYLSLGAQGCKLSTLVLLSNMTNAAPTVWHFALLGTPELWTEK